MMMTTIPLVKIMRIIDEADDCNIDAYINMRMVYIKIMIIALTINNKGFEQCCISM